MTRVLLIYKLAYHADKHKLLADTFKLRADYAQITA